MLTVALLYAADQTIYLLYSLYTVFIRTNHKKITSRILFTYLFLILCSIDPSRKIVSITAKATKQRLKEFFMLGLQSTYPAKIFEATPSTATRVLATPSNQKAVLDIILFSAIVSGGQRAKIVSLCVEFSIVPGIFLSAMLTSWPDRFFCLSVSRNEYPKMQEKSATV